MDGEDDKKTGLGGAIILIVIGVAIWYMFFRTDYTSPWIKQDESKNAGVVWCENHDCNNSEHRYVLEVTNFGKSATGDGWYILEAEMPNSGTVEVDAFCLKNEDSSIPYDRYCQGLDNDSRTWRFYPL